MKLEILELWLLPNDATQFQVTAKSSSGGEAVATSRLPFWDNTNDWRTTLIKTLETSSFRLESFGETREQDWMMSANILAVSAKYLYT